MTCIVAVKDNGKVLIGGDSLGSNYQTKTVRVDQKVFIKGDMLFGFTSSFRMGQILEYAFTLPERPVDVSDMQYLVGTFIPALMTCYKDNNWLKKEQEIVSGGVFLLGYRGEIYKIESDFQVGISTEPYGACGSGAELALGSLHTTHRYDIKAKERITLAIEAASHHVVSVGGPIHILSI